MKYRNLLRGIGCFFSLAWKLRGWRLRTRRKERSSWMKGVAAHSGLDEIYRRFSEGYKKLDSAAVANLYTETAAYLQPGGR